MKHKCPRDDHNHGNLSIQRKCPWDYNHGIPIQHFVQETTTQTTNPKKNVCLHVAGEDATSRLRWPSGVNMIHHETGTFEIFQLNLPLKSVLFVAVYNEICG